MTNLPYTCVFCHKPGTIDFDETIKLNPVTSKIIMGFKDHIACDHCAKYYRTTRDMTKALYSLATKWLQMQRDGADLPETRNRFCEKATRLIERLDEAAMNFRHVGPAMTPQMVETFADNPCKCSELIRAILTA
jgi:hypothetical protein